MHRLEFTFPADAYRAGSHRLRKVQITPPEFPLSQALQFAKTYAKSSKEEVQIRVIEKKTNRIKAVHYGDGRGRVTPTDLR